MANNDIRKTMRKKLYSAMIGCAMWHHILRKYHIKNSVVLFFPSTEHSWNYHALLYLKQLISHSGRPSAIILTVDETVKSVAPFFSPHITHNVRISAKDSEHLLDYYSLGPFDNRLFVISLDRPFGRNADKLIGVNKTSVAEIISLGIFRLPNFFEEPYPMYRGNDPILTAFLDTKEFGIYGD